MIADYLPFIGRMISRYEGGYGWNARDPGGPTNFGITCFDLAEHRHRVMDSMAHWAPIVRAMSLSEAEDIYAVKYAGPMKFNALTPGKDTTIFDTGVNSGPSRSIKFAQEIVGVSVDGVLGPITLTAINAFDATDFVNQHCDIRLRFLQRLPTWDEFGRGWSARVADLRQYSLNLVHPPAQVSHEGHSEKLELIPLAYAKGY